MAAKADGELSIRATKASPTPSYQALQRASGNRPVPEAGPMHPRAWDALLVEAALRALDQKRPSPSPQ